MERGETPIGDLAQIVLLMGAVTGHNELSYEDRLAIGRWTVDHADVPEVRELLVKIVATQISETAEWRVNVAEAIRQRFRPDGEAG